MAEVNHHISVGPSNGDRWLCRGDLDELLDRCDEAGLSERALLTVRIGRRSFRVKRLTVTGELVLADPKREPFDPAADFDAVAATRTLPELAAGEGWLAVGAGDGQGNSVVAAVPLRELPPADDDRPPVRGRHRAR